MSLGFKQKAAHYAMAVLGITMVATAVAPFHSRINGTTVALALVLVILSSAILWGSGPALAASVSGVLCFNFFFLPPLGTFTIEDPQNWVALAAFFITAITVGQLSARARRRAAEAEMGQRKIERLYEELRDAFERASQAEALRRSEKLKSALLDAVSHDIRTPLTSIKASVTTLLDEARGKLYDSGPVSLDPVSRREMLEVIDEESDRLDRFVEDLIELARIEAGQLGLRRTWGAVDEIITTALERARSVTEGHPVDIDLERDLPAVRIDPRAVSEVVYNLVDNAAKYSAAGGRISIEARRLEGEMIQVTVEDRGEGIPEGLRERVFDKFFRATQDGDGCGRRRPAGTGMGLAIARGIVEAHGGRIRIESGKGGRGCRVVFTLPQSDEDEPVTGQAEDAGGGQQPDRNLIVNEGQPEIP